ncbi:ThiF family adenylyltransferase [Parasphingorhabdus sp.]|uniref:ThiF family adenylyltransferase n=1 Tax=Parasphingorhabdus sp. TaxID=2709688 RepID=UPI0030033330
MMTGQRVVSVNPAAKSVTTKGGEIIEYDKLVWSTGGSPRTLRVGVMDGDRVEARNLCRHILSIEDVGHFKAIALARRLSTAMPDADIKPIRTNFPPIEDSSRIVVQGFDVIVDCTGSDVVLDDLAAYPWNEEKIFISLGMTWAAEGLVAFAAPESIFPSLDARSFFAEVAPHRPDEEMPMEGLGRWHPVFPARANDTMFWASQGVSFIQQAILERSRKRVHYRRTAGGGVERNDY